MGGLAAAWLLGEGIVIWREVRQSRHMPVPGNLLGVTGLFLGLALIGDIAPASRTVVTLIGFGLDVAGLMQVLPGGLFGQVQQAQQAEATAEGQGTSTGSQVQAA
jgi:hypothetical protein